jgi:iron complex outermembrane receptor protein
VDPWQLNVSYSLMHVVAYGRQVDADSIDKSPMQQVGLRSSYDFMKRASLDTQLRYVDRVAGAPAYVAADVRLSYRPTSNLELALVGQDLLQRRHTELDGVQAVTAEIPRGFYGKITWWF